MADIVGQAAVDVIPIVPQFHRKLREAVLPAADRVGAEAGRAMGERMAQTLRASMAGEGERIGRALGDAIGDSLARQITTAIPDAVNRGGRTARVAAGRQGDNAGGAFASSMRRKLEAAFKAMPKLDVRLGDTGVDAELARIRAKLEALSNKRIGIDVSAEDADAEVARLDAELRRLGAAHPNIAVRADTAAARAALAEMRAEIAELSADPLRIRMETDGSFGQRLRRSVQQAQASLPEVNIDADTSDAMAQLQSLRAQLATLADARVGIDIDAATATAQISAIQARLQALSASDADVAIRVDAGAAAAELAAVHNMVNRLDRDDVRVNIHVNHRQAMMAILQLTIALGGVAAIPAIPVMAAGLGAIASAGVAAGAGLGAMALVAIPAIKGITTVTEAKKKADEEAASATDNSAVANVRAAQQAMQMTNAQSALASAHRNAARSIASANRAVEDAERGVAQAALRAADQRRQATKNVERAERTLRDAKKDALQAEKDLIQARKDAAEQLRDLNDRLAEGSLDQREATLRVQEAQEELNRTLADPRATQLQIDRAQLAADQAEASAKKQAKDYAELQESADKQRKAGIAGNADVVRATERVSTAQQNVKDQATALTEAQRQAARAQVEAAESVADAQRRLSDAVQSAADAQVNAAESIASAERGVESARLSGIDTTAKSASAQDEYRKALAKLTPAQRDLYDALEGPKGLKSAFSDWHKELQKDVLPIFTRAVEGAKNSLPGLTPLVQNSSRAVADLQERASKRLKSPFWQEFKTGIQEVAEPAIEGLGVSFGNIFEGMMGIVAAFFPHMDSISERMQRITERFADWGTGLKGSEKFESFLAYAAEMGPVLAEALGDIFDGIFEVLNALSPLSTLVLDVLGGIGEAFAIISEHAPWLIQGVWLLIVAIKAWTLAQWLLNAAMSANPIALVVIALAALVAAGVWAFNKFPEFRKLVLTCWEGIQKATSWVWEEILQPVFEWIWDALQWVGDKFVWLYDHAVRKPWNWIAEKSTWLWEVALKPIFKGMWDGLKWLGDKFVWLWEKGVRAPWNWISDKTSWLGDKLGKGFGKIKSAVKLVGEAFEKAKDAIGKAWDKVVSLTKKPTNFVIKMVYTNGIKAIWDKVAGFVGLDKLPEAPKLLEAGGTVGNGWGVAAPMKVNRPTAIVGEGNPRYPEYVIPTDPKYRGRAKALHQAAGTQLLESGGVIGWAKNAFTKGLDWAKTGADLITNPGKIFSRLMRPVTDKVKDGIGPVGMIGKALVKLPFKMIAGLKDKVVDAVSSMLGGGWGGGQWGSPVNAKPSTRFGVAGSMWSSGYHTGLDFAAKTGAAVKAVSDGRVSTVGRGGPYGNHIIIDHPKGLQSLYAHLSKIQTTVPKAVSKGDRIGAVGATGNTTGPHLHLEARKNGRAVDPMPYLTAPAAISGKGVERWRPTVKAALTAVGQPHSLADTTLRRMQQESGGDPHAVNRWDINWSNGTPSVGLMQVIKPTFRAYAGKYKNTGPFTYGVSTDPMANIYSSMRYALSRYGSLSKAYNRPGGYAAGGFPALGELAWVGEQGPELVRFLHPAQVHSNRDSMAMARSARSVPAGGGGAPTINADVRVFVGNREITDIVRTEVVAHDKATASSITTGRYL
ncbi:peptidoglycan DD-metalloendopeptidase family protein [Streptomyces sp. CBG33]|uniref:peptidoglycan DD-metalloendopeptidase family protein n=1 Tax=Streptomyces sp. CBG33 TaxID=2762624 RepID=UPI0016452C6F|nr:peptidoglycan DD-metalloendopeptidase family protein [Streptomyces sp. CBG33]